MLQCGALESASKRHHSRLFDHLGWGHKQRRRNLRPKSWRPCLEGFSLSKVSATLAAWTIVHLQRAGLTMKTILVPTQNTPAMQSKGGAAHAAHRRLYRGRSASVGMSRKYHEQKYFCYLVIRQANSTTVAPSAAAIADITIPPPSARSTAM
jgi:hypothetical protein